MNPTVSPHLQRSSRLVWCKMAILARYNFLRWLTVDNQPSTRRPSYLKYCLRVLCSGYLAVCSVWSPSSLPVRSFSFLLPIYFKKVKSSCVCSISVRCYFCHIQPFRNQAIIVPHRIIRSWYTGRWWVGCYIWYSEEGTGQRHSPPRPLLAVPNVPAHPSTAIVPIPITVLLYNGPLLYGFNVAIKGSLNISNNTSDAVCTLVQAFVHSRLDYCNSLLAGVADVHLYKKMYWLLLLLLLLIPWLVRRY